MTEDHANSFNNKWNFHENKAVDLLQPVQTSIYQINTNRKLRLEKTPSIFKDDFPSRSELSIKLHFCSNEISKSLPIPVQFLVGHIQVLRPTLTATNNQKPNHISKISINKTSADNIIINITDARLERLETWGTRALIGYFCKYLHPQPDKSI